MVNIRYNFSNYKKIVVNRKIYYDYFIYKTFDAGIELKGWEVKSIRCLKININNSYVSFVNNELYLINSKITPIINNSINDLYEESRNRKLLLNRNEINVLYGAVSRKGFSMVSLFFYWKKSFCKSQIALVKGKKKYEKRFENKLRDWRTEKNRILKNKRRLK